MELKLKEQLMRKAFDLALQGTGSVSPNPLVGAIIYKNGKIIGEGYHQKYGQAHAEVNAVANASEDVEGATLICTLEPCCHTNKQTPPCTKLIIEKKIAKVIVCNLDPNPEVAGKGLEILKEAGIEVESGILESRGKRVNEVFFKYITTKMPFVHGKVAQTLDGKIMTATGDSKWISNETSRTLVHEMRFQYDAVLVGSSTLRNDNPSLTIRMGVESNGKCPWRIVIGTKFNDEDFKLNLFQDEFAHRTIVATTEEAWDNISPLLKAELEEKKVKFLITKVEEEKIDLNDLLTKLGEIKISSVLVEGGSKVMTSFIEKKLVDKLSIFVAPKLIGNGVSLYVNDEKKMMSDALQFSKLSSSVVGENQVLIEARF